MRCHQTDCMFPINTLPVLLGHRHVYPDNTSYIEKMYGTLEFIEVQEVKKHDY
jgi:hypothetical protein